MPWGSEFADYDILYLFINKDTELIMLFSSYSFIKKDSHFYSR